MTIEKQLQTQHFANGYDLVNGVQMHADNGEQFSIPHPVLKKHVGIGHFIELRIDSPRFSAHPGAPGNCTCSICKGEATKPILSHDHPATLLALPKQTVPSRGWGEDFWARVTAREGDFLEALVDNPLYEARLHELHQGDSIYFHKDHILAVHNIHRQELVLGMDAADLKQLAVWLGSQKNKES